MDLRVFAERLRQDFKEYLDLYPGSGLASLLRNDEFMEWYFELFELSEEPEHGYFPLYLIDKQTSPEISDPKPEFYPTKHRVEKSRRYKKKFSMRERDDLLALHGRYRTRIQKAKGQEKQKLEREYKELIQEWDAKIHDYLKATMDRPYTPYTKGIDKIIGNKILKGILITWSPEDKGGRPTENDGFYRTVRLLQLHLEKRGIKRPHRKIADYLADVNRILGRPGTDRDKLHEIIRKVPLRINIGDEKLKRETRNEYFQFCKDFNIPYHDPFPN